MSVEKLRAWARSIKRDVLALWIAARDPRTPWYVKVLGGIVTAYAFSPVDLIPDFIPVLGYLDDLLLVPLGIALVVRLIPRDLLEEFRERAARSDGRPVSRAAATVVIVSWVVGAVALIAWWVGPGHGNPWQGVFRAS